MELRRKLYSRGNSFETTVPRPMLFALDMAKKYYVVYNYDQTQNTWIVTFEEIKEKKEAVRTKKR